MAEGPCQGRQRSIRANTKFFLYDELRRIAFKTFGLAEPVQQALKPDADQIEEAADEREDEGVSQGSKSELGGEVGASLALGLQGGGDLS